jgi:hypothetical protein
MIHKSQMTAPNPLIITIHTCQEMMVWNSMKLIGSMDVIWKDFGSNLGQITADFCHTSTTNLNQHDSGKPDDRPKSIDYHHLDMSRDDGME